VGARCRTERGFVVHSDGRRLGYGELAEAAARLGVPAEPRLKTAAERHLVGTPTPRLDAPRIVAGAAGYGIDVRRPGMLVASLERPPTLGARPVRVDAAAARAVSGVRDVFVTGQAVAVVADGTYAALKGRSALAIDWEPGPNAGFGSEAHWGRLEEGARQPGVVTRREGTMPTPSARARVLTARYHYPFAAHAPVEPMNCVAHVHDGRCDLWAPTQAPGHVQKVVAERLGLAPDQVHVEVTLLGGGFGRRLGVDYALEAAEVARRVAAPVQVLWTRVDDMRHGHFQAASVHDMWGVVEDGRGVAWRHKKVSSPHNLDGPPGAEALADPVAFYQDVSWGAYDVPYAFPAIETAYVPVDAPVPIGPWRAVFSPPSTFARECFMDELAGAAGQDPLAFRLAMLAGPDVVAAGSLRIDRRRLRRVLELVAEKSGWGGPAPAGRFRGLACNVYDGQTHVAYVVEVSAPRPAPPGRLPVTVHRVVCALDCGVIVNPLGVAQQVESGVVWSLSNLLGEITFAGGRVVESSYRDFHVLRMSDTPIVETHLVPSHGDQPYGVGEPTVPPLAPAVANAVFAATGQRVRRLPLRLA
jgi:isoquinoline 1-oxidoreductase beta subunit